MSRQTKTRLAEAEAAKAELLTILKPGDTVHLILRHCSASGMTRQITPLVFHDSDPWYLTHSASVVLGWRVGKHDGIVVGGCGMDMGFHLVYQLSVSLFCPDGYTRDGAYALKHRWL